MTTYSKAAFEEAHDFFLRAIRSCTQAAALEQNSPVFANYISKIFNDAIEKATRFDAHAEYWAIIPSVVEEQDKNGPYTQHLKRMIFLLHVNWEHHNKENQKTDSLLQGAGTESDSKIIQLKPKADFESQQAQIISAFFESAKFYLDIRNSEDINFIGRIISDLNDGPVRAAQRIGEDMSVILVNKAAHG